jgi:uncharacterized protein (TIGR00269 family)
MLKRGDTIAVAISGGKDSAAMLHVLSKMARKIGGITLVPVLVDEGIEGYRSEAKKKAAELCGMHGLALSEFSYRDFAGFSLDEMMKIRDASADPALRGQRACSICGVFRRYLINKAAASVGADKVAVGHNADDLAQTFLMNVLRADVPSLAKSGLGTEQSADAGTIPRIKPLAYIPERECAYYCEFQELPYHLGECPHSSEAFRGLVKDFLNEAEQSHPGIKFNVLKTAMQTSPMLSAVVQRGEMKKCARCGELTSGAVCRACGLKELLAGSAGKGKAAKKAATDGSRLKRSTRFPSES